MGERWNTLTGQLGPRTLLHKRYLIQKVVGRGGMGAVYMAKDLKRRGALCAVKEMSLSMIPAEERTQAIQNFKFEAKMLWGLSHPNLPAFTNFFSENQRYFLVMEFIEGQTLEELLDRQNAPFPERRVLRWAEELCDVLEYLHSQHPPIIFRDMKPGNIMLTRQGHVKLIDFGIARFFRPAGGHDTQQLGTPGYASPEQYGQAQTDERSDIYSLGMTLAHLLTNQLHESPIGIKARTIRSHNPQVSPQVAHALEGATAPDPEMRYESIAAFRRALTGTSSFSFETGEIATQPAELADLCARYPEEASEYLANGEIDHWLHDIGEEELAHTARLIRDTQTDPLDSVEQFVRAVAEPQSHARGHDLQFNATNGHYADERAGDGHAAILDYPDQTEDDYQQAYEEPPISQAPRRSSTRLFPPLREAFVQVSPRKLDFGSVYPPGPSAPLSITISGFQGMYVSGTLHTTAPWIRLDHTHFDGVSTTVNVHIQTANLQSYSSYEGEVIVEPDGDEQEFVVTVLATVYGYSTQVTGRSPRQTVKPDEDDEEDLLFSQPGRKSGPTRQNTGGQIVIQTPSRPPTTHAPRVTTRTGINTEHLIKYGLPDAPERWEPCVLTPAQEQWQRFGRAIACALMMACFWYTWLLPNNGWGWLLPPNPAFILLLSGLVPTSTLGALIIFRRASWLSRETLNRAITGMACALCCMAPVNLAWQIFTRASGSWIQLALLLLVTALGAVLGTTNRAYNTLLEGTNRVLRYMIYQIKPVMFFAAVIGAVPGYFLTAGLALSWFTPFGILLGTGIACSLVWRVYRLQLHRRRAR